MTKHDDISIFEAAAAAGLGRSRDERKKKRKPITVIEMPTFGSLGDIAQIKPQLADATHPIGQRIRLLWAAAKQARHLSSNDEVFNAFRALAVETRLINAYSWVAPGVGDSQRNFGPEDVAHVLRWAMRGKNPFDEGDADQQRETRDVDRT
jgi:hypothetical protein